MEMIKPEYDEAVERCGSCPRPRRSAASGLPWASTTSATTPPTWPTPTSSSTPTGGHHLQHLGGPGQGADIGTLSTAHEALRPLGLAPEQIHLYMNDTAHCPDSGPAAAAARSTWSGNAIVDSCNQLLAAMTQGRRHLPHLRRDGRRGHRAPSTRATSPPPPCAARPTETTFQFTRTARCPRTVRRVHGRGGGRRHDRQDHGASR